MNSVSSQDVGPSVTTKPSRLHYIDWLRVLAMLAIFVYHSNRFFDEFGWHLKNADQSIISTLFTGLLDVWLMPLFFLLSGVGSWYALKFRSGGQYLFDRVKRLLIPLYTVGIFIIVLPQVYFEEVTNHGFTGTFWEMIPNYFSSMLDQLHASPLFFNVFWGHLWFLQFLFLISLVTLPLLIYLKSEAGQKLINKLATWCSRWGGVFLFLIPLILVRIGLKSLFEGQMTWAELVYYAVFFLIGYIIPADNRFTDSFKRCGWVCLALGIVGWGGVGFFIGVLDYNYPGSEPFSLMFVLFQIILSIANLSWVVFILGLGVKYLNFGNKTVNYGNDAVLPFYILHQTIILVVGWFVITWDIGILPKYLIIIVVSFILIMALYELLIRRINIVRFLFGMRLKKKAKAE
ncbi:acyltransferase family protein [Chloroflexota bacterium]